MASSRAFLLAAAVAITVAVVAPAVHAGNEFPVGGFGTGWKLDYDYEEWAKTQSFFEGDTLVFQYPKGMHNVIEVTEEQQAACEAPDMPMLTMNTGSDKVKLKAGKHYFICGFEGHCARQMKITVNVMSKGNGIVTIDV